MIYFPFHLAIIVRRINETNLIIHKNENIPLSLCELYRFSNWMLTGIFTLFSINFPIFLQHSARYFVESFSELVAKNELRGHNATEFTTGIESHNRNRVPNARSDDYTGSKDDWRLFFCAPEWYKS
jgi:hypothetical protein